MSSERAPIFVAGATGNVGRPLVKHLAEAGWPVHAGTRDPASYNGPAGATPVRFDAADSSTHASALENAQRAFVLVPADVEAQAQLSSLFSAAEEAGIERVAFMTAMGVDQAPSDMPLRAAELQLQDSTIDATFVRPNWFHQNFLNYWMGMIQEDGVMRLPAGDAATSFVDTRDIAAVAAAALTEDGHAGAGYTVTGPEALTYDEAARVLSEAAGRKIQYEPVSDEEAHRLLTDAGLDPEYVDMLVGLFANNVRPGHMAIVSPDVENATGRSPRSLEAFARENADAWAGAPKQDG